jgi:hypothetical protein
MVPEDIAATSPWSTELPRSGKRTRRRDLAAPLIAVALLLLAHFLFGAGQTLSNLSLSAAIIAVGLAGVAIAGPRHATIGMLAGAAAIWAFALTGWAGPLERATPELASLFAAGVMWTMGYTAARQRRALDFTWTGIIWTSLVFCVWFFFTHVAGDFAKPMPGQANALFDAPASAALLFGLFVLVGAARVLHVIKRTHAEASSGAETFDRIIREGLGGILLVGFAVTCLLVTGTLVGVLFLASVLLGYVWWDTLGVIEPKERSSSVRLLSMLTPVAALALAGWGFWLVFMQHEALTGGDAIAGTAAHIGRLDAYFAAFLQQPVYGHGLGSIAAVGDQTTTLQNAGAMLAPGGAQNVVLTWLVETGVAGTAVLFLFLFAMHLALSRGFGSRRIPRTFLRLAFAASALMLLHGLADSSLDLPSAVWLYAFILGAGCGVASLQRGLKKRELQPV